MYRKVTPTFLVSPLPRVHSKRYLIVRNQRARLSKWQEIPSVTAYTYSAWGNEKFDSQEYDKAIKGFDKAIDLYPDDTEAHVDRGRAKRKLGQYKAAIQDYTEAIKQITDDFIPYYNPGHSETGKWGL